MKTCRELDNRRNQRKFRKSCLIVSITFTPSIFTDFLIKIVNTTTCLPLANRKLSNLLKIQRPLWILSSTIVDKFLESILEPRDKTPLISKLFRHGTQDAKLVNFVFLCVLGSLSLLTCRILKICCDFFHCVCLQKTITNSIRPNWWAAE